MIDDLLIREYQENDEHQILDLLNSNFKGQQHLNIERDLKWWEWKYKNNPFGDPIINVIEHDKKIIACRPFWPWELTVRGRELKCYQPVDAVVDKHYRGCGIFTKLTTKTLLENKDRIDLIFNFSNEQSIRANLRVGWTFIGKLHWYVKVNNIGSSFKQMRNSTGFISVRQEDDDRINKLKIDQVKEIFDFSGKFKTDRTKEFLIWRYMQHPQINYGMKIIETKNKQFAYIYEVNENKFGRELIVVDYFGDMELFNYMLEELDAISKKYSTAFITLISKHNTPANSLLRKLYVKQKRKNFLVMPLNLEIEQSAIKYNNWDMFLGMHDSV